MPEAVPVTPGTLALAVAELVMDTGPLHAYVVTPDAPFAERFNVLPEQIGPLLEAPVSVGDASTVNSTAFVVVYVTAVESNTVQV
jgi:hypothetical protein